MFNLSTKSDYGLLLLSLLAKKPVGKFVSLTDIVKESKLPHAFVSRIAAELAGSKLLISKEGSGGGYKLAKNPQDINLAQVIDILDGAWQPTKCEHEGKCCKHKDICPMADTWQDNLKGKMRKILENYTIKDLVH